MQQQTAFKIERGIPLPERQKGGRPRGGLAETLRRMKKGDSVFVPSTVRSPRSAKSQAFDKSYPGKRAVRIEADGIRIWRVT